MRIETKRTGPDSLMDTSSFLKVSIRESDPITLTPFHVRDAI